MTCPSREFQWPKHKGEIWCHVCPFSPWKLFSETNLDSPQQWLLNQDGGFPKDVEPRRRCPSWTLSLMLIQHKSCPASLLQKAMAPHGASTAVTASSQHYGKSRPVRILHGLACCSDLCSALTDTTKSLNLNRDNWKQPFICLKHTFFWWFLKTIWKTV